MVVVARTTGPVTTVRATCLSCAGSELARAGFASLSTHSTAAVSNACGAILTVVRLAGAVATAGTTVRRTGLAGFTRTTGSVSTPRDVDTHVILALMVRSARAAYPPAPVVSAVLADAVHEGADAISAVLSASGAGTVRGTGGTGLSVLGLASPVAAAFATIPRTGIAGLP